jgi:hypothetical protein
MRSLLGGVGTTRSPAQGECFVTSTTVGRGPWFGGPQGGICCRAHEGNETRPGPAEDGRVRNKSVGLAYPGPGLARHVPTPGCDPPHRLNSEGVGYRARGIIRANDGWGESRPPSRRRTLCRRGHGPVRPPRVVERHWPHRVTLTGNEDLRGRASATHASAIRVKRPRPRGWIAVRDTRIHHGPYRGNAGSNHSIMTTLDITDRESRYA